MLRNEFGVMGLRGLICTLLCVPSLAQDRYQPKIEAAQVRKMEDARTSLRRKDVDKSVGVLSKLVTETPDYFLAHYNLGIALSNKGDNAGSLTAFQKALAIREAKGIDEWSIYNATGWAYVLAGDTKKAEELLKVAEQHSDSLTPGTKAQLWNNLGYLYMGEQNFEKAKPYLELAKSLGSTLAEDNLRLMEQLSQAKKASIRSGGTPRPR